MTKVIDFGAYKRTGSMYEFDEKRGIEVARERAEIEARNDTPRVNKGAERWNELSDEEKKSALVKWKAENVIPTLEDGEEES